MECEDDAKSSILTKSEGESVERIQRGREDENTNNDEEEGEDSLFRLVEDVMRLKQFS